MSITHENLLFVKQSSSVYLYASRLVMLCLFFSSSQCATLCLLFVVWGWLICQHHHSWVSFEIDGWAFRFSMVEIRVMLFYTDLGMAWMNPTGWSRVCSGKGGAWQDNRPLTTPWNITLTTKRRHDLHGRASEREYHTRPAVHSMQKSRTVPITPCLRATKNYVQISTKSIFPECPYEKSPSRRWYGPQASGLTWVASWKEVQWQTPDFQLANAYTVFLLVSSGIVYIFTPFWMDQTTVEKFYAAKYVCENFNDFDAGPGTSTCFSTWNRHAAASSCA